MQDLTEDAFMDIVESSGISKAQMQKVLRRLTEYGLDLPALANWVKRAEVSTLLDKILDVRVSEVQDLVMSLIQKVKQQLKEVAEDYNIPDVSTLLDKVQRLIQNPSEITKLSSKVMDSGRAMFSKLAFDEEDDENDDNRRNMVDEEEDDEETLSQTEWGKHVKNMKRVNDDEDEDFDLTVFVRILGDEIGFASFSDLKSLFNLNKLKKMINWKAILDDILDGFDIQPTIAAKTESVHSIATGLGLPIQLQLNVTGVATVHLQMRPQGTIWKSLLVMEPSGALQVIGGMTLDIPSIHSISIVSNTTLKSEFEVKLRTDIRKDSIEIEIEKPDEELDLIQIRNEMTLRKDDEDYEPFDEKMTEEIDVNKCLPEVFERITGLKMCVDIDSSKLKNLPILSVGPHELRISIQKSSESELDQIKFNAKHFRRDDEQRIELNLRAPGRESQREARAVLRHDRNRNDFGLEFEIPEMSYPRLSIFLNNLSNRQTQIGGELGVDIEFNEDKHYNGSITAIADYSGYDQRYGNKRVVDLLEELYLNYTLKGSVQVPDAIFNVSTTTAKRGNKIMMEHNITAWIAQEVQLPYLQKLRQFETEDEEGLIALTVRHGVQIKMNQLAHDIRGFVQLLAFPESLQVPEPVLAQVAQLKIHRDLRHIGLHWNGTMINHEHKLEFFNASLTINDIVELNKLQEPVWYAMSISRNDWFVGVEGQLEKKAGEYKLKHEVTGRTYLAQEYEEGWRALRSTT